MKSLIYELSIDNGTTWNDIGDIINTNDTVITQSICTNEYKSAVDTANITLRAPQSQWDISSGPTLRSSIIDALFTLYRTEGEEQVLNHLLIRISEGEGPWEQRTKYFYGCIDRSSITLTSTKIPGAITIQCKDISVIKLDDEVADWIVLEKYDGTVKGSDIVLPVEQPDGSTVEAAVPVTFSNVVKYLLRHAGYQYDLTNTSLEDGDDRTLPIFVVDADDSESYRDYIDALLFEAGGYVLNFRADGVAEIVKLPYDDEVAIHRVVTNYNKKTSLKTETKILEEDGVELTWSTVAEKEDEGVYVDDFTRTVTESGTILGQQIPDPAEGDDDYEKTEDAEGNVIDNKGSCYWPAGGEFEATYQEFDSDLLDYEYNYGFSQTQNKDLSILAVRDVELETKVMNKDGTKELKFDDVFEYPNIPSIGYEGAPVIYPTKAWYLLHLKDETQVVNLVFFRLKGRVIYRDSVKTSVTPATSKKPEEYESAYIYTKDHAEKFARWYWQFLNYSRFVSTWTEYEDYPLGEIVDVAHKGSNFGQASLVVQRKLSFFGTTKIWACTAVGLGKYNEYPIKDWSSVHSGSTLKSVIYIRSQYSLGTKDGPVTEWTETRNPPTADNPVVWTRQTMVYNTGETQVLPPTMDIQLEKVVPCYMLLRTAKQTPTAGESFYDEEAGKTYTWSEGTRTENPTAEMPFLWRYDKYVWSDGYEQYGTPYLVMSYIAYVEEYAWGSSLVYPPEGDVRIFAVQNGDITEEIAPILINASAGDYWGIVDVDAEVDWKPRSELSSQSLFAPFLWKRTSSDNGLHWTYTCVNVKEMVDAIFENMSDAYTVSNSLRISLPREVHIPYVSRMIDKAFFSCTLYNPLDRKDDSNGSIDITKGYRTDESSDGWTVYIPVGEQPDQVVVFITYTSGDGVVDPETGEYTTLPNEYYQKEIRITGMNPGVEWLYFGMVSYEESGVYNESMGVPVNNAGVAVGDRFVKGDSYVLKWVDVEHSTDEKTVYDFAILVYTGYAGDPRQYADIEAVQNAIYGIPDAEGNRTATGFTVNNPTLSAYSEIQAAAMGDVMTVAKETGYYSERIAAAFAYLEEAMITYLTAEKIFAGRIQIDAKKGSQSDDGIYFGYLDEGTEFEEVSHILWNGDAKFGGGSVFEGKVKTPVFETVNVDVSSGVVITSALSGEPHYNLGEFINRIGGAKTTTKNARVVEAVTYDGVTYDGWMYCTNTSKRIEFVNKADWTSYSEPATDVAAEFTLDMKQTLIFDISLARYYSFWHWNDVTDNVCDGTHIKIQQKQEDGSWADAIAITARSQSFQFDAGSYRVITGGWHNYWGIIGNLYECHYWFIIHTTLAYTGFGYGLNLYKVNGDVLLLGYGSAQGNVYETGNAMTIAGINYHDTACAWYHLAIGLTGDVESVNTLTGTLVRSLGAGASDAVTLSAGLFQGMNASRLVLASGQTYTFAQDWFRASSTISVEPNTATAGVKTATVYPDMDSEVETDSEGKETVTGRDLGLSDRRWRAVYTRNVDASGNVSGDNGTFTGDLSSSGTFMGGWSSYGPHTEIEQPIRGIMPIGNGLYLQYDYQVFGSANTGMYRLWWNTSMKILAYTFNVDYPANVAQANLRTAWVTDVTDTGFYINATSGSVDMYIESIGIFRELTAEETAALEAEEEGT